ALRIRVVRAGSAVCGACCVSPASDFVKQSEESAVSVCREKVFASHGKSAIVSHRLNVRTGGVQGSTSLWKTLQAEVLRVLEVNTFEPLVKNVNATAQPYVARLSGRQGEVLRETR
ncbi:hypothetical protein KDW38_13810, partial [Burkholderia multivorans]|uniref:hypothetical protein n=1 Tax=Burkholderia multivorans TaxID=87883 RepID=UPI001BA1C936